VVKQTTRDESGAADAAYPGGEREAAAVGLTTAVDGVADTAAPNAATAAVGRAPAVGGVADTAAPTAATPDAAREPYAALLSR